MATQLAHKLAEHTPSIPDRLYFKIGDVARICELETYVLRFWETQFPQLKPNKSGTGQRLYRRREVELALEIKRLVHAEGYTLAGARQALDQVHRNRPAAKQQPLRQLQMDAPPRTSLVTANLALRSDVYADSAAAVIRQARAELREIASLLAAPVQNPARRRPRLAAIAATSGSLFSS